MLEPTPQQAAQGSEHIPLPSLGSRDGSLCDEDLPPLRSSTWSHVDNERQAVGSGGPGPWPGCPSAPPWLWELAGVEADVVKRPVSWWWLV